MVASNAITDESDTKANSKSLPAPDPLSPPTCLHLDPRQGDQDFEVADYYQFETGSGLKVLVRYDEWSEYDPGLERQKAFDEKFYNEVGPEDFARLFWQLARSRKGEKRRDRFAFLIKCAYAHRESETMRTLAEDLCRTFFHELDAAENTSRESGGPYVMHATLLAERGDFAQAIAVCQRAETRGVADGTNGGFAARISRLRGQEARAAKQARRNGTP